MIEKRKGFPKFRLCDENIETLNGWDGSTARFRSVRPEMRSRAVETEYFANLEAATFFLDTVQLKSIPATAPELKNGRGARRTAP